MIPEAQSRSIFISYRRSDSEGEAGRLSDMLSHSFAEHAVFMDVDAIQPGRDFRKAIEENISQCAVLLTVIGPDWLSVATGEGVPRLQEPNDYVRLEVAAALRRDIAVIPVLVRGARMPRAEQLPPDIADLAYRNSVELTHARWKSDLQHLLRALEPSLQATGVGTKQPTTPPTPEPSRDPRPAPAEPSAALSPETLERVREQLAHYIGPIASLMVRRNAGRHSTVEALKKALAEEIEHPADRKRFLAER